MPCQCSDWGDRVRINLGYETADLLRTGYEILRARNPWLDLAVCRGCGAPWYVAVDTVDDDYYFRRLSSSELAAILERDEWPADFDDFVNVWPMGTGGGHMARLVWPWKDDEFEIR
jgi:hypothetical protein